MFTNESDSGSLNCAGRLVELNHPKVMAILNLTPDSFYDGGENSSQKEIIKKVSVFLEEGATFIDLGGASSRPGAKEVSVETELNRLLPVLKLLVKQFPEALFSIDTYRAHIARVCVDEGAVMINDISAGEADEKMLEVVGKLQVPYVMMHKQGTPKDMQRDPVYEDVTRDILYFFSERLAKARGHGINDILIDPGFGFGKTISHNYQLLRQLKHFNFLGVPVLAGLSRKSMIYKPLEITPTQALNGSTALHILALLNGASILRVHDVKEAVQSIKLMELYKNNEKHLI